MPLASFAKYPLLFGPSPVHRLDRRPTATVLYAHLGGQPALNGYSALFS